MHKPFKKVILFGRRHTEKAVIATLLELNTFLKTIGIEVVVDEETALLGKLDSHNITTVAEKDLHEKGELIIVIGGDGSLLNAAHIACQQKLPVVGINRGHLGFLTDISPDQFSSVEQILKGHYQTESRFLLEAQIISPHQELIHRAIALNDVVLLPSHIAQMIEFTIEINGEFMCTQRADGMIVATPTGSTAYALSGGGPILHPQLNAIALVPMFPHTLTSRPIVLSHTSIIDIAINHSNPDHHPRLSFDGQTHVTLNTGDKINIRQYAHELTLIHPLNYQYFSTLRSKLHWENKPY